MTTRDFVLLYVNGERHEVRGEMAFWPLSDYLRYQLRKTGTKVVCAEGDCGACTALKFCPTEPKGEDGDFRGINTCIYPVFLADCSHLVTVEGLKNGNDLHPVQQVMIDEYGSQCGFCTPGFVMALADMFERNVRVTDQDIKNHLTGNLCRCTGYQPILNAAHKVSGKNVPKIRDRYSDGKINTDLRENRQLPVTIQAGNRRFESPVRSDDVTAFLKTHPEARIYSGATDLGVRLNKAGKMAEVGLSLNLIADLYRVDANDQRIYVGAKVSLRRLEQFVAEKLPEFADFLHIFASPQIKESATLVGNLMNGSPIADTVPYLFALDAQIDCRSVEGARLVSIHDLFTGYKTFSLKQGEWVAGIEIPLAATRGFCRLYKVSQRRDLDISGVNAAILAEGSPGKVIKFRFAIGGVGPTTLRLTKTEAFLVGKTLDQTTIDAAEKVLKGEITPLSDVRGSAGYRHKLAINLLRKFAHDWNETSPQTAP